MSIKMLKGIHEESARKMREERLKENQNLVFLNGKLASFSLQKSRDAFLEEMY